MTEAQHEIMKKVYDKYPKTEGEKKCRVEREIMARLRERYRLKLEQELKNKNHV